MELAIGSHIAPKVDQCMEKSQMLKSKSHLSLSVLIHKSLDPPNLGL